VRPISKRFSTETAFCILTAGAIVAALAAPASAGQLVCRKVVSETTSGEGANTGQGSRVKCALGEMLTGGTCYPETRPEADGTCQTSAMGVIQPIVEHPGTTEEAFFTCLQTGGSDCPVAARTRAMAICCKIVEDAAKPAPAAKP
jgi:hypothetical protein